MPTRNRGKHPDDDLLFAPKWQVVFAQALQDLSYLLSRDYGVKSATQLVGNRYRLNSRQQKALSRMCASTQAVQTRQAKACEASDLQAKTVAIDGFNLLILLESALSGAYILNCQDSSYRDISSVHGSYKRVLQTQEAILLVGRVLEELQVKKVDWFFDAPVSNSGRLKVLLYELATEHGFPWDIYLVNNPDRELLTQDAIVVSSDAWVLDECQDWFNLGRFLIDGYIDNAVIFC